MAEPRGPGRLSSLDLLPDEAAEDVAWAFNELRRRKLTQDEIREQLNLKLQLKGLEQISRSAFNRAAIRTARMAHRLGEVREIAGALASKFEDGGDEQLTLLAAETIKAMVFETLENAGRLRADGETAEMLANFALAIKSAEQAKKVTADARLMIEKQWKVKAESAIANVAARQGLSREKVDELRRDFLGISPPSKALEAPKGDTVRATP
jgi:Protein of unknown function (DUF3486)